MTSEIRAFEYALGLFAVLIGLSVADVATSFHRLARGRAPVVWDPLCLAAALFALCMAVGMWFDLWGIRNVAGTRHFFYYLSMVAEFFVLFLIAAVSLPDEVGESCDLREYYARNRRYFWLLVALFQLSYLANGLYFVGAMLPHMSLAVQLRALNGLCVPLIISLVLASVSSRVVHYVGILLLFVSFAVHYAPYQIN